MIRVCEKMALRQAFKVTESYVSWEEEL